MGGGDYLLGAGRLFEADCKPPPAILPLDPRNVQSLRENKKGGSIFFAPLVRFFKQGFGIGKPQRLTLSNMTADGFFPFLPAFAPKVGLTGGNGRLGG